MQIRPATADDLPDLAHTMAVVFGKTPKREYIYDGPQPPEIMAPLWYNDFVKQFHQPRFRFVVTEDNGRLLGGAVWELQTAEGGEEYGYPLEASTREDKNLLVPDLLNKDKLKSIRSALSACTPDFMSDLSMNAVVDLAWIAILPAGQGRGLGSALLAEGNEYYRSLSKSIGHAPPIVVLSLADKVAWYERSGFRTYCELVTMEGAKLDEDKRLLNELLTGAKWLMARPEP